MAGETVIDMNDPERRGVTLNATWQAETALRTLLAAAEKDDDEIGYLIEAIVPRLLDLNSVVMSAAGDDMEDVASLKRRLMGGWRPIQATAA